MTMIAHYFMIAFAVKHTRSVSPECPHRSTIGKLYETEI